MLNALMSVAAASIVGRNTALGPESRVKETATLRRDPRFLQPALGWRCGKWATRWPSYS